jgi:hypothetical protein
VLLWAPLPGASRVTGLEIGAPALTFVCALIFSLVPAFESRSTRLNQSLRVNTTQVTSGSHVAQIILVISEVAVSLVLMVAATMLLTSFWKLMHTPPGFDSHNVVTFKNAFTDQQVESTASLSQRLEQLTTRLEALPGVASAAAVSNLPTQLVADLPFDIIGRAKDRKDASGDEKYVSITDTIGTPCTFPSSQAAFTTGQTTMAPPQCSS